MCSMAVIAHVRRWRISRNPAGMTTAGWPERAERPVQISRIARDKHFPFSAMRSIDWLLSSSSSSSTFYCFEAIFFFFRCFVFLLSRVIGLSYINLPFLFFFYFYILSDFDIPKIATYHPKRWELRRSMTAPIFGVLFLFYFVSFFFLCVSAVWRCLVIWRTYT